MSDSDEDDLGFVAGTVIESSKNKYVIVKLLGAGGFGAVYRVHDQKDPSKMFALKVEKKIETRKHSKLKMEIAILKLVSNERRESHFTAIIDRGKKETYFFLVMELVGKSLADLKNARPDRVFSISTGLGASIQCLEACQDLHKYGFIHRDLKPANYACGLGEKKRIIYILDFGIARRILNDKNELKTPRVSVRFKGTIPFASIACHKGIEMGPKDDCESWFYLMLDLSVPGGLIWKRMADKHEVLKVKEECRTTKRDAMFGPLKCKEELGTVLDYIDKLQYQDHVDYTYIYKMLEEASYAALTAGGNVKNPYDWENDP
ncbi:hypothetical protein Q1695_013534 [Nippostrongylus brasiliensis]|nr:hypothetical protein Q1695_013534 [Nippostrongylus brasiliensis]